MRHVLIGVVALGLFEAVLRLSWQPTTARYDE